MSLPTPISAMRSSLAPWNSAGYSIAPAPMMAPWPFIRRGTECTVPMLPGLVSEMVTPDEVLGGELAVTRAPDDVLVGAVELREVHRLGVLDRGDDERAAAVLAGQVDGQTEVGVRGGDRVRLAVDLGEVPVHVRERLDRLHDRVTQQVRERDLAAAGTGEVVVDDDPVVEHQLRRDGANAGGGRNGQRGRHVLGDGSSRAAENLRLFGTAGAGADAFAAFAAVVLRGCRPAWGPRSSGQQPSELHRWVQSWARRRWRGLGLGLGGGLGLGNRRSRRLGGRERQQVRRWWCRSMPCPLAAPALAAASGE